MATVNLGISGIGTATRVTPRDILSTDVGCSFKPGYATISGADCRDAGNADVHVLRAGYMISKDTVRTKGGVADQGDDQFKGTCLGFTTANYTSGGTSLTVSAATATELNRRYGSSGENEFYVVGDTDLGSGDEETAVAFIAATHSAVNTTTGVITVTTLGADFSTGSMIIASEAVLNAANDQLTETYLIYDRYGIRVTNDSDASMDVELAYRLIAGQVNTAMIVDYPTNPGLRRWLKDELRDSKIGLSFSDDG